MKDIDQPTPHDLIAESVQWVVKYVDDLRSSQVETLRRALAAHEEPSEAAPSPVDINNEIQLLMHALKGLRREVMDDEGRIVEGKGTRDAREVVTSITSLLSLLMRSKEKLDHMDRLNAIEEATVAAVKQLDGDAQDRFFAVLEERLGEAAPA